MKKKKFSFLALRVGYAYCFIFIKKNVHSLQGFDIRDSYNTFLNIFRR